MRIKCKKPNFILRKDFERKLVQGFVLVYFAGETYDYTLDIQNKDDIKFPVRYFAYWQHEVTGEIKQKLEKTDNRDFWASVYFYDEDTFCSSYMCNPNTGEMIKLFYEVPCMHCLLCKKRRTTKFMNRCILEGLSHKQHPIFITLTYAPEYLPKDVADLSFQVREMQLFNKRLRKLLHEKGYSTKYKYFLVSEYGSKRGRLHYHGLLFGMSSDLYTGTIKNEFADANKRPTIPLMLHFIRKAWHMGIITSVKAYDSSGRYCFKYMRKMVKKRGINLHSNNFGKQAILDRLDEIRRNPEKDSFPVVVDEFVFELPKSGIIFPIKQVKSVRRNINIDDYILSIAMPSVVDSTPFEFREALFKCHQYYMKIKDLQSSSNLFDYNKVSPKWDRFFKLYEEKFLKFSEYMEFTGDSSFYFDDSITKVFSDFQDELFKLLEFKDIDIEQVMFLNDLHSRHIAAVTNLTEFDIRALEEDVQSEVKAYEERENDNQ